STWPAKPVMMLVPFPAGGGTGRLRVRRRGQHDSAGRSCAQNVSPGEAVLHGRVSFFVAASKIQVFDGTRNRDLPLREPRAVFVQTLQVIQVVDHQAIRPL